MAGIYVDDSEVRSYMAHISKKEGRIIASGYRLVYKLTKFAKNKMEQGIKPKTSRTTGKLKSSVRYLVKKTGRNVTGIAYIPTKIKYQFAAEHGFKSKKKDAIHGHMGFSPSAWRQYSGGLIRNYDAKTGKLMFTVVSRGKYKGMHFTEKAFDKTVKKASKELNKTGNFIIRQLVIST